MKTVKNRYSQTQVHFSNDSQGILATKYTYESCKALYDVVIFKPNHKSYAKNCAPCEKEKHHEAIEKHFKI